MSLLEDLADTLFPGEQTPDQPDKKWGVLAYLVMVVVAVFWGWL